MQCFTCLVADTMTGGVVGRMIGFPKTSAATRRPGTASSVKSNHAYEACRQRAAFRASSCCVPVVAESRLAPERVPFRMAAAVLIAHSRAPGRAALPRIQTESLLLPGIGPHAGGACYRHVEFAVKRT